MTEFKAPDLTLADLEGLEALEKAASSGPWESCHDSHSPGNGKLGNWVETRAYASLPDPEDSSNSICDCPNDSVAPLENAQLIAALRNAAPALLAAARRLLELESALECIRRESLGSMLSKAMWPDDGHDGTPVTANLLALAESLGWQPPTTQPGER